MGCCGRRDEPVRLPLLCQKPLSPREDLDSCVSRWTLPSMWEVKEILGAEGTSQVGGHVYGERGWELGASRQQQGLEMATVTN